MERTRKEWKELEKKREGLIVNSLLYIERPIFLARSADRDIRANRACILGHPVEEEEKVNWGFE